MKKFIPTGIPCLIIVVGIFYYIASVMEIPHMLNTIMNTAHDLLLNTVFYLMGICVITGALGRIFVEFGVVKLLEKILRPLMKPLFNLPGTASLGAVLTFLSDNPAIISLAKDVRFGSYFKKIPIDISYQFRNRFRHGIACYRFHDWSRVLLRTFHRFVRGVLRLYRFHPPYATFHPEIASPFQR